MVWFPKGGLKTGHKMYVLLSKMSGFQMVRLFENRTRKCRKSQMFGFQLFGIQMATVQDTKMHKNTKSIEAETYKLRPSLVILQYNYFVGKPLSVIHRDFSC